MTLTARACALVAVLLAFVANPAAVLVTVDEALQHAYPGHVRAEKSRLILNEASANEVEKTAGHELVSKLVVYYAVYESDADGAERLAGIAILDTHLVRTLAETVLVAIDPEGRVLHVEVLAFNEPREYLTSRRWLDQFDGEGLDEELRIGREIRVIAGATLSSRAVTAAVRRALALHSLALADVEGQQ